MTFDMLPEIVKKRLIAGNYKKKLEQFKKHRLKSEKRILGASQGVWS